MLAEVLRCAADLAPEDSSPHKLGPYISAAHAELTDEEPMTSMYFRECFDVMDFALDVAYSSDFTDGKTLLLEAAQQAEEN